MNIINRHERQFSTEKRLIEMIINKEEKMHRDVIGKKIMALAYLRIVEFESSLVLEELIGKDLSSLYDLQIDSGLEY